MTAKSYKTLTDALKSSLQSTDLSYQELERRIGVARQSMMRFVDGKRSLRLDNADKLTRFFGLDVVQKG